MQRAYRDYPIIGIGVIVLCRDAVLLVRRGTAPAAGTWSLPGGAQELGETMQEAARRELKEETGLIVGDLVLAGYVDSIHRDPTGRIEYHYSILDFAALWRGDPAEPATDVSEIAWARFDDLPRFHLKSEAHRVIDAARRLLLPAEAALPAPL